MIDYNTLLTIQLLILTDNIARTCGVISMKQRCSAGSAPGAPRTMDSSNLGARRRLGHDTTNTTQQGRYPA